MMRKRSYSQQRSSQTNGYHRQSTPFVHTVENEEGNEGGLNLGQLLAVIRRRILVIIIGTTTVASASVGLAWNTPPMYSGKFEILTEPITAEDKIAQDDRSIRDEIANKIDETKLRILQSDKLMSPITQEVQKYYPGSSTPKLNIKLLPNTQIIEVTYQDRNSDKLLFVLNKVSKAYLKYSLDARQTKTKLGIEFVEQQLPKLFVRVTDLQLKLQNFRQKYGIIDAEVQGQQLANQLDQIVQKQIDNEIQLAKTQKLYTILQTQLQLESNEAEAISALSESPDYQKLLSKLQDVESTIAVKLSQYTENSPNIQNLLIQKQNLLDLILKERSQILGIKLSNTNMNSLYSAAPNSARLREIQKFMETTKQIELLKTQKQVLNQSELSLRKQVKQFPVLIRQKDDLERQLKIAVDNLTRFLSERERLRIDAAQKQIPWQIITPPSQPEDLAPSTGRNLILGVVLGLLLSTGLALIIDTLNNAFYNLEEIKDKTKLPILGNIPNIKFSQNGKLSQRLNTSNFWESFHSIYTNIDLLNSDNSIRSLAIISATSGDGKSTIAIHLAQTAAAMGKRVLLVDANLRHPSIHEMLNLPNKKGLSNLITEELSFEDVIHKNRSGIGEENDAVRKRNSNNIEQLPLGHNLSILTTGQIPPNPTILLSSPQMENLTEQFKQNFDLIIYDTSHLLGSADTNLLTRHIDASILVVKIGKTNRSCLTKVLEQLNFSSTPILGAIAIDL